MTTQTQQKPTLILTAGLPGSGKSTWAREQVEKDTTGKTVRVNRDEIRKMAFGKYVLDNPREQEPMITSIQQAAVKAALRAGLNVIVDDTNLNGRFRQQWERLAQQCGAHYRVHVMDTGVDECIRRDKARWETEGERLVGEDVIRRMAQNIS